jgi:hypothetical protein
MNSLEKIIPLKSGMEIYIPPKGKFVLDTYDKASIKKASIKKASFKQKKKSFTKKRRASAGIKKVAVKYKKKSLKPSSKRT